MPDPTPQELAAAAAAELEKGKPPAGGGDKEKPAEAEGGGESHEESKVDPVEQAARAKGWKPEGEYTGDPGTWIPAKEFLAREPLHKTIKGQSRAIKELKATVEGMAKHFTTSVNAEVERRVTALKAQKREAVKEGDVERVEALDTAIEKENARKVEEPKKGGVPPEIESWIEANDWYVKDREMHVFAKSFNEYYLQNNPRSDLETALEETTKAVRRAFPDKFKEGGPGAGNGAPPRTPKAPVEGGGSPPASKKGYSVSRLNAEQRMVYDQIVVRHKQVGHDQFFKDLEEAGGLQ